MILCNIGGDPSLEPSGGGWLLSIGLFLAIIVYLLLLLKNRE